MHLQAKTAFSRGWASEVESFDLCKGHRQRHGNDRDYDGRITIPIMLHGAGPCCAGSDSPSLRFVLTTCTSAGRTPVLFSALFRWRRSIVKARNIAKTRLKKMAKEERTQFCLRFFVCLFGRLLHDARTGQGKFSAFVETVSVQCNVRPNLTKIQSKRWLIHPWGICVAGKFGSRFSATDVGRRVFA